MAEEDFPAASVAELEGETQEAAFVLRVRATAGASGEKVHYAVFQGKKEAALTGADGEEMRYDLKLTDGDRIEIRATNAGAVNQNLEKQETTRRWIHMSYYTVQPMPQFTLKVKPLPDGAEVPVRPGEPVVVSVAQVRIIGEVKGAENLQQLTRDGQPLAGFEAGKDAQFTIKDEFKGESA